MSSTWQIFKLHNLKNFDICVLYETITTMEISNISLSTEWFFMALCTSSLSTSSEWMLPVILTGLLFIELKIILIFSVCVHRYPWVTWLWSTSVWESSHEYWVLNLGLLLGQSGAFSLWDIFPAFFLNSFFLF